MNKKIINLFFITLIIVNLVGCTKGAIRDDRNTKTDNQLLSGKLSEDVTSQESFYIITDPENKKDTTLPIVPQKEQDDQLIFDQEYYQRLCEILTSYIDARENYIKSYEGNYLDRIIKSVYLADITSDHLPELIFFSVDEVEDSGKIVAYFYTYNLETAQWEDAKPRYEVQWDNAKTHELALISGGDGYYIIESGYNDGYLALYDLSREDPFSQASLKKIGNNYSSDDISINHEEYLEKLEYITDSCYLEIGVLADCKDSVPAILRRGGKSFTFDEAIVWFEEKLERK